MSASVNVNSKQVRSLSRKHYRDVLGYLLLFMLAYGATVETVHTHGLVSPGATDATGFFDAGGLHSSHTGHSHEIECSICAFQQQLFNGLFHEPLFALSPLAQIASVETPAVIFPSTSITRQSGRAPPLG